MKLRGFYIVLIMNLLYIIGLVLTVINTGSTVNIVFTSLVVIGASIVSYGYYKGKIWGVYGAFILGTLILVVSVIDGYTTQEYFCTG